MRDIIINFILAGKDTTAYALTMTLHHILGHPEVEAKLREELDSNIRYEGDSDNTLETIDSLQYLNAVVHESLRLTPSVPFEVRTCLKDVTLDSGIRLFRHQRYGNHPTCIHQCNHFSDPENFNPDNFIDKTYTDFEFFAFAGGPRKCLGKRFALLEIKMIITYLFRKFKM